MSSRKRNAVNRLLTLAARPADELARLNDVRRKVVEWCNIEGELRRKRLSAVTNPLKDVHLSPRMLEILKRLLVGDSEKEVARRLKISVHTVHTHVKNIHKAMRVTSRGELLAKFVQPPAD